MSDFQQKNQSENPSYVTPSQQQEDTAKDQGLKKDSSSSLLLLGGLTLTGAAVGAAAGSPLGPIGAAVGAVAVGAVCSAAAEFISDNVNSISVNRPQTSSLPTQPNSYRTEESGSSSPLKTKGDSQNEKQCLALVLGADAESLCKKLGKQGRIDQEDWETLYAKTQDLLLKDEFLDPSSFEGESITSEYSVYIISMRLDWSKIENAAVIKPGFEVGASKLEREDAFEQLPHIARDVQVSKCLSPTSYQGQGFYQC